MHTRAHRSHTHSLARTQDEDLARQLVALGYRGSGETMKRDEFEARKKASREKHSKKQNAPKVLASASADLTNYPFLQALANREELVRAGKLTSIIFIRDMKKGATEQEVSGNTSRLRPDRIVLCVLCAVRCTVCCTSTVRCCTSSLAPTPSSPSSRPPLPPSHRR